MRFHITAAAYALWILAIFIAFYMVSGEEDVNAMQFTLMCGAIPAACQVFLLGIDWRGLIAPVKMWLALLAVILVSYVVNGMDPWTAPTPSGAGGGFAGAWLPIVYTLNTIFIM